MRTCRTVDYLYTQFVQAVADYRGVSVDQVLADMADGRIFHGQRAVDAGGRRHRHAGAAHCSRRPASSAAPGARRRPVLQPGGSAHPSERKLHEHYHARGAGGRGPELLNTIEAGASAAGASAERARILGVEAHSMPGHEDLIASLKADGKTTPDRAAAAVLAAHRGARRRRRRRRPKMPRRRCPRRLRRRSRRPSPRRRLSRRAPANWSRKRRPEPNAEFAAAAAQAQRSCRRPDPAAHSSPYPRNRDMSNPGLIKTHTADGAIGKFRIVAQGAADGNVKQATAGTDALLGVTEGLCLRRRRPPEHRPQRYRRRGIRRHRDPRCPADLRCAGPSRGRRAVRRRQRPHHRLRRRVGRGRRHRPCRSFPHRSRADRCLAPFIQSQLEQ